MLEQDREEYLVDTTIIGTVTFINQLKHDAIETIQTLSSA